MNLGTKCFENENEIVLSVGVLENNIITINKQVKNQEFINLIREMVSGKVVDVDKSTEVCEKLIELLNMGFIVPTLDSIEERILILDLDESIGRQLNFPAIDVMKISDLLEEKEIEVYEAQTDALAVVAILKSVKRKLPLYNYVFIIGGMHYINRLIMLNNIIKKTNKKTIFFTYDSVSCYIVGVDAEIGTGCFECLITKLMNKKYIEDSNCQSNILTRKEAVLSFLKSICLSEIENICVYGSSTLLGNAITYIPGMYQYTFDFNRRTNLCTSCSEDFYRCFEEQNVVALNIIKQKMG